MERPSTAEKELRMDKCVYCGKNATATDAVGLPACSAHENEADEYHRDVTGQYPDSPIRRNPVIRAMAKSVGADFVVASDHPYTCTCDLCREWWRKVGPEDGLYGPFGESLE